MKRYTFQLHAITFNCPSSNICLPKFHFSVVANDGEIGLSGRNFFAEATIEEDNTITYSPQPQLHKKTYQAIQKRINPILLDNATRLKEIDCFEPLKNGKISKKISITNEEAIEYIQDQMLHTLNAWKLYNDCCRNVGKLMPWQAKSFEIGIERNYFEIGSDNCIEWEKNYKFSILCHFADWMGKFEITKDSSPEIYNKYIVEFLPLFSAGLYAHVEIEI